MGLLNIPRPPTAPALAPPGDPKLAVGSYIEDGVRLYRVMGRHMTTAHGLQPAREVLDCENCLSLYPVGLEVLDCQRHWRLVRALRPPAAPEVLAPAPAQGYSGPAYGS